MATARPFTKTVCKCERCGHEWLPKSEEIYTCPNPKCRSVYWDKPKDGKSPYQQNEESKAIILDEKAQAKAALQCAIIQDFNCEHYANRTPATALCSACFVCDFWATEKVKMLKEAFLPEKESEKQTISVQGDEVFEEIQNAISKPEIEGMQKEPEPDLPKTVEEALAKLEQTEITGRQNNSTKPLSYDEMRLKCYKCMEKYKDNNNDWQCNFFYFKSNPKFDYCRLCWELSEIWKERAVGPRK